MKYLLIVIFFVQGIERTWTEKKLTLQTGGSVTIPCHYDREFIQNKKYWCYDAYAAFNYCKILAYANTTEGKVTVTDKPAQSLFTVTMRDLEEDRTGTYWCAVKIEGIFQLDVTEKLYFTVTSAPAVSVNRNSVSGEEGSSVSVQCLYSAAHKNKHKQWCRSTDWSCYTVGRTYTSQNSAVWIREGIKFFKVEMTGLKKSDAGWFWCSVGDLQVPVHLTVTDALTGTPDNDKTSIRKTTPQTRPGTMTTDIKKTNIRNISPHTTPAGTHSNTTENKEQTHKNMEESITVICSLMGVGLLLTVLVCSICMSKRKCKVSRSAGSAETDTHTAASTSDTVLYSSVGFKSKKSKQNILEKPPGAHDDIIYTSVANR
ncbi:polymeric immunoglobulin receptor-like [Brachyhypopomus gauderio]|uniref:polymeric immunoglobulin receptor-like n=1 Tax=Brachyhypopomus gauderio TaxID=698409 RepID=UPI004042C023